MNQPERKGEYMRVYVRRYHSIFLSLRSVALILILLSGFVAAAQRSIPEHAGKWVHDEAGILNPQTIQELERYLKHHRDSTSNQIAVLTIKSLEGDDIDEYAFRVAE